MSPPAAKSDRAALALVAAAASAATVDIASFVVSRRQNLAKAPSRAGGSVAGLLLWSGLLAESGWLLAEPEQQRLRRVMRATALTCGLGNIALGAVHLRVRKGVGRGLFGAALGALAIAASRLTDEPVSWGAPS